jgi:hypothetical protein
MGRAAIFADCGLGKTPMQLTWAQNVVEKTNKPVLILTPLAVAQQTIRESSKFGVHAERSTGGRFSKAHIVVANYERLAGFDPADFAGVVCDESSILKNFAGKVREAITAFMKNAPYRLLCTATPSPNDYMEFGTSSEALGVADRKHMLTSFFIHDSGETATWRLKGHARAGAFWKWMTLWARALRKPSDMGYPDGDFSLPELIMDEIFVPARSAKEGYLFDVDAIGLKDQRENLRRTIKERCESVAQLAVDSENPFLAWVNLNDEGNILERMIPGAVNVQGSDPEEFKEESFDAFSDGGIRVLISKPTIAGFGLNWQHCNQMSFFPSHSYEQMHQSIRRCWRFGQTRPVRASMITTEGQAGVMANLRHKSEQADRMFENIVREMAKCRK